MKRKNKSWKTTAIALFGAVVLLIAIGLVWFGKATITDVATALSPIAIFITSIGLAFAKDSDVTGLQK